jgi:hypothetical protein
MTEIDTTEDAPLAVPTDATSPILGLLHAAVEKQADPDTLEKLTQLFHREQDREAVREFAAALSRFQAVCPPIKKTGDLSYLNRSGTGRKSTYATLEDIDRTVKPLLAAEHMAYTWNSEVVDERVRATCTLHHSNGHTITAQFEAPLDSRKNDAVSDPQKHAAALTFARRQSLIQVVGLTDTDEDTDARPEETITAEQAIELDRIAYEVEADIGKFKDWLSVEELTDLKATDFTRAKAALESRRAKAT